jgi:hypothetical protein
VLVASDGALRKSSGGQDATEAEILRIIANMNEIFNGELKPNLKIVYMGHVAAANIQARARDSSSLLEAAQAWRLKELEVLPLHDHVIFLTGVTLHRLPQFLLY